MEEIDLESLHGYCCVPLLTQYFPSELASVMTMRGIVSVGTGNGGNGTNTELEVNL